MEAASMAPNAGTEGAEMYEVGFPEGVLHRECIQYINGWRQGKTKQALTKAAAGFPI